VDHGPTPVIYSGTSTCPFPPHGVARNKNLSIATALPCRIALYQQGADSVTLSTLLPTVLLGMFETPELEAVAEAVESDVKSIMDEAAKAAF